MLHLRIQNHQLPLLAGTANAFNVLSDKMHVSSGNKEDEPKPSRIFPVLLICNLC